MAVQKNTTGNLYGITPGANAASKALILDKDSKIDSIDMTALKVGGVSMTATAAELNKLVGINSGLPAGSFVVAEELVFTEDGGTTYTGAVTVPAGAYLIDVVVHADVVWDDTGAVTMKVGDVANDDGIFIGVDMKATDLVAAEQLSFGFSGGLEGADLDGGFTDGDHLRRRFLATARVISGIITTANQNGSAGVTRMLVVYVVPATSAAVSA